MESWAQNVVVVRSVQVLFSYGNAVDGGLAHWCVLFVSDQLVFEQFIFEKTSILAVSCVLSSCGKSNSCVICIKIAQQIITDFSSPIFFFKKWT